MKASTAVARLMLGYFTLLGRQVGIKVAVMSADPDINLLAMRCRELFDLETLELPDEYRYASVGH